MKKLITTLAVLALMLCLSVTAYAEESNEQSETPKTVVQTLDELQTAISAADDGDEIIVAGQIYFEVGDHCIGDPNKTIILTYDECMSGQTLFLIGNEASTITLQNLSLMGGGLHYDTIIQMTNSEQEVILHSVTIRGFNCHLHPICNTGTLTVDGCTFQDNSGRFAGHIKNEQGQLIITNSRFSGGVSETAGGAIQNFGTLKVDGSVFENNIGNFGGAISTRVLCEINNSIFTGNIARFNGGAIINNPDDSSVLLVTDCEIYGNSAEYYGDDICNEKDMTIQYTKSLSDIYVSTGRSPHGWQSDAPEDNTGETARIEYAIPIITSRESDGTLYIRFVFEDEVTTDNNDDDGTIGENPPEETYQSETVNPENTQPTESPDETEDATSTTPGDTGNTPSMPSEGTNDDIPVVPDDTGEQPTVPDTTNLSTPPAEGTDDTTLTIPNGVDNEQPIISWVTDLPITSPTDEEKTVPTTPEVTESPASTEVIEPTDVLQETDDSIPANTADDTTVTPFVPNSTDSITPEPTETAPPSTECDGDQQYATLVPDANEYLQSGESSDDVLSDVADASRDTIAGNAAPQKFIESASGMSVQYSTADGADDVKVEKVSCIVSGVLVANIVEVGVLVAIFVLWLRRKQK